MKHWKVTRDTNMERWKNNKFVVLKYLPQYQLTILFWNDVKDTNGSFVVTKDETGRKEQQLGDNDVVQTYLKQL